ncbi:hypothetical protein AOQ84DRAFT_325091 [Glonium stellatum]|uniref:Uncharacterized protein n=1 Tax=Glonium stellatum TaxID=574774 RepID=A0A8E2ESD2_9PEZI|nr:hypothetical protein AOQ84DRAFT_325091 [Glonium stellatum]
MPPSTSRTLISSSSSCQICPIFSIPRRPFATSQYLFSLPPESPKYIEVPRPLQSSYPVKPRVKGVLPVPRDIFQTRSDKKKGSLEFLNAAAKEPSSTTVRRGPDAERIQWKQRMAEVRRKNLRQGVMELRTRKLAADRIHTAYSRRRQQEHEDLVNRPEREDERLTKPSVSKSIRDFLAGSLHTTPTAEQVEERRLRHEKREQMKEMERKDALHTLYMQARNFIVTEEQLDQMVEKAFGTEENPVGWTHSNRGLSPWEEGMPDTIQSMLSRVQKTAGSSGYELANQRLKKIAEELTGGKI